MPSSGLSGAYDLTEESIDERVARTSAGAYALGYTKDNTFRTWYVGRADDDVNGQLKDHIGEQAEYQQFKYGYCRSTKAAYQKECALYHDFKPPYNRIHPAAPPTSYWACPRGCGR
jgi:hypothetical protein